MIGDNFILGFSKKKGFVYLTVDKETKTIVACNITHNYPKYVYLNDMERERYYYIFWCPTDYSVYLKTYLKKYNKYFYKDLQLIEDDIVIPMEERNDGNAGFDLHELKWSIQIE